MYTTGEERKRRIVFALAVLLGFALLIWRRPAAIATPTFWAEDGAVFYLERRVNGLGIFAAYQDQLWVLQRLLSGALPLPPEAALHAYHLVSVAIATLALSVILQQRAAATFSGLRFRLLGFALLIVMPGVWEIQGNLSNLHVYAAISGLLCLTFVPPGTTFGKWAEGAWVLVISLSGFVARVLLPAAIWQAFTYRSRWAFVRLGLVATGMTFAVVVWVTGERPVDSNVGLTDKAIVLVKSVVLRVASPLLFGEQTSATGWQVVAAVILLVTVAGLILRDWRGPSPAWAASGAVWIVLGVQSLPAVSMTTVLLPFSSERYFAVMIAAVLLVMVRALACDPVAWVRVVAALLVVATVPGLIRGYSLTPLPAYTAAEVQELQRCAQSDDVFCPIPVRPAGWLRSS